MSEELILYIKSTCPWCIDAKAWLNKSGYNYREKDIQKDASAGNEMRSLSGQTKVPTLVVGSKILADFGVDELIPFLKKENIQPG